MAWELLEAAEAGSKLFGFWRFVGNRRFRATALDTWRQAGVLRRLGLALEAAITTGVALGLPLLLGWLLLG